VSTPDDTLLAQCAALDAAYAAADEEARLAAHPTVRADLKWSLWTTDQDVWERCAPETWRMLRLALTEMDEDSSLTLHTAPRKETRYGTVVIRWTDRDMVADVAFSSEWDEPRDLAHTLLCGRLSHLATQQPDPKREALRRLGAARTEPSEEEIDKLASALAERGLGTQTNETGIVMPNDLAECLALIDDVENRLLDEDAEAWKRLSADVEGGVYDYVLDADVRQATT
jgi:hypothetical protein